MKFLTFFHFISRFTEKLYPIQDTCVTNKTDIEQHTKALLNPIFNQLPVDNEEIKKVKRVKFCFLIL